MFVIFKVLVYGLQGKISIITYAFVKYKMAKLWGKLTVIEVRFYMVLRDTCAYSTCNINSLNTGAKGLHIFIRFMRGL